MPICNKYRDIKTISLPTPTLILGNTSFLVMSVLRYENFSSASHHYYGDIKGVIVPFWTFLQDVSMPNPPPLHFKYKSLRFTCLNITICISLRKFVRTIHEGVIVLCFLRLFHISSGYSDIIWRICMWVFALIYLRSGKLLSQNLESVYRRRAQWPKEKVQMNTKIVLMD